MSMVISMECLLRNLLSNTTVRNTTTWGVFKAYAFFPEDLCYFPILASIRIVVQICLLCLKRHIEVYFVVHYRLSIPT